MKKIRQYFGAENTRYFQVFREERNLCALLYHMLLMKQENLTRFLDLMGCECAKLDDVEMYIEYAFLRDIWNSFGESAHLNAGDQNQKKEEKNQIRRKFILDSIELKDRTHFERLSIPEFNEAFISKGRSPSPTVIQSPSTWSISKFHKTLSEDAVGFTSAARFKWCFNVKPDIVIVLPQDKAIVIEAKFVSKEGTYPSSQSDKKCFGKVRVRQTEIQEQALKILGFDAKHIFISKNSGTKKNQISWERVFNRLDRDGAPFFFKQQIESALARLPDRIRLPQ